MFQCFILSFYAYASILNISKCNIKDEPPANKKELFTLLHSLVKSLLQLKPILFWIQELVAIQLFNFVLKVE